MSMTDDEKLVCPVHGEVEGLSLTEGPLSETHPWAIVCEKCDPFHSVIVGWELDGVGVRRDWEDFGEALA
jgi:hypothetical protein